MHSASESLRAELRAGEDRGPGLARRTGQDRHDTQTARAFPALHRAARCCSNSGALEGAASMWGTWPWKDRRPSTESKVDQGQTT